MANWNGSTTSLFGDKVRFRHRSVSTWIETWLQRLTGYSYKEKKNTWERGRDERGRKTLANWARRRLGYVQKRGYSFLKWTPRHFRSLYGRRMPLNILESFAVPKDSGLETSCRENGRTFTLRSRFRSAACTGLLRKSLGGQSRQHAEKVVCARHLESRWAEPQTVSRGISC